MTTDIFIVSVGKHFNHLRYCLRSIKKFCSGFRNVLLLIPTSDATALHKIMSEAPENLHIITFNEWLNKGFIHHMYLIMCADEYTDADLILHTDSDCVFTEPLTPDDYMEDGKPVLMFADYEWLCNTQQANLRMWQEATINAIGKPVPYETMRRHPAVHYRDLYPLARQVVERHTRKKLMDYMMAQRNEFPQQISEFNVLGSVAMRHLKDKYRLRDQKTEGFPPAKLHQAWTHAPPTAVDLELYSKIGIA